MMKKLAVVLAIFGIVFAKSQETIPTYQQYLLEGKYLFNPAHYGETDDIVIDGIYQKQFSKLEHSPNVQTLGIHANVVDRLGLGLSVFRDQNGAMSANGLGVGASYFIPLGDDGRADQFSFGANVNFYNMSIDLSLLNAQDAGDPLLQSGTNSALLAYTNLGLQATYKGFFGSVSMVDIPLNNEKNIVNGIEPSPTKFFVNVGYDWAFAENMSVEPSVMLNLNTNSSRMLDFNLLAKIKDENNYLAGGISYRTAKEPYGGQRLSIAPIVKGKVNRFTFGAAYNVELSGISQVSGNSFMLSIGYCFENFINGRGFR